MEMATTIGPEVMARYRRSALAREMLLQRESEQRRQAAHLLREEFGATRVIAFGSLAHGAWFEPRCDHALSVAGSPHPA